MNVLSDYDRPEYWQQAEGYYGDGLKAREWLEELFTGNLSTAEKWEILDNLFQNYYPSTAGIVAVPLLLLRQAPDQQTASLCADFAGAILTHLPPESEFPEDFRPHVSQEFRVLAERRLLETVSAAAPDSLNLLFFTRTILSLRGENDLAEKIDAVMDEESTRLSNLPPPPSPPVVPAKPSFTAGGGGPALNLRVPERPSGPPIIITSLDVRQEGPPPA